MKEDYKKDKLCWSLQRKEWAAPVEALSKDMIPEFSNDLSVILTGFYRHISKYAVLHSRLLLWSCFSVTVHFHPDHCGRSKDKAGLLLYATSPFKELWRKHTKEKHNSNILNN